MIEHVVVKPVQTVRSDMCFIFLLVRRSPRSCSYKYWLKFIEKKNHKFSPICFISQCLPTLWHANQSSQSAKLRWPPGCHGNFKSTPCHDAMMPCQSSWPPRAKSDFIEASPESISRHLPRVTWSFQALTRKLLKPIHNILKGRRLAWAQAGQRLRINRADKQSKPLLSPSWDMRSRRKSPQILN